MTNFDENAIIFGLIGIKVEGILTNFDENAIIFGLIGIKSEGFVNYYSNSGKLSGNHRSTDFQKNGIRNERLPL